MRTFNKLWVCQIAGLHNFSERRYQPRYLRVTKYFMICQNFREVVKCFRSNHKYLVTVIYHGKRHGYPLSEKP